MLSVFCNVLKQSNWKKLYIVLLYNPILFKGNGITGPPLVFTPNPFEVPVWTRLLKASCAIQYRKQGKYHVILVKVNCATLYVLTLDSPLHRSALR